MSSNPAENAATPSAENDSAWRSVRRLLTSEAPPGLERVYPGPEFGISLLAGLARPDVADSQSQAQRGAELQEVIQGLLGQLDVFGQMSRCPILAITGLLNAGKSSLLATYLSPQGRARVLRGLSNNAGTHRFVLWLPKIWWDDTDLLGTLIRFLTDLFGHAPELLAEDPEVAAMQYNGQIMPAALMQAVPDRAKPADESVQPVAAAPRAGEEAVSDAIQVPLIAYDEQLDGLQLGLVDCPDIQTGFVTHPVSTLRGSGLAEMRQQQLKRIGRLCSAFVIVTRMNSLHDEGLLDILSTLRDAMPGVPRMLAVNRVKARYAPPVVYDQSRALIDRFGIRAVYAAYDFRSSLADTRIPAPPADSDWGREQLPIFFQVDPSGQAAPRDGQQAAGSQLRYLYDLGAQLDAGTLSRESNRSLRLQLKSRTLDAVQWHEQNQNLLAAKTRDAWEALAAACYEFMAERDAAGHAVGLRLQASPSIVAQMADSLHRTAPWWMKASLSIDRTARQLHSAIANSAARFKILQTASDSVTQFAKRFKRGEGAQVVTKERFAKTVRGSDVHQALQSITDEQLEQRCEYAMSRFASEDRTLLKEEELDQWSHEVWHNMSFKDKLWKGTQPLAVVLAPLLAVVLVPIDAGGSAVLVFASAKELLAAAGIAAVMGPLATGGEALRIVQRETPWRQLSDLFAILCDCVGIQRPTEQQLPKATCERALRKLLPSGMEVKPPKGEAAICHWRVNQDQAQELQLALKQLA